MMYRGWDVVLINDEWKAAQFDNETCEWTTLGPYRKQQEALKAVDRYEDDESDET